jgi:hypothetical protein
VTAALELRPTAAGVCFRVRVHPRSSREAIHAEREGALVVRLQAAPVDGAANEALARLLGRTLGVAPSAVRILRGGRGRSKLVAVDGIDPALARERLSAALGSPGPR